MFLEIHEHQAIKCRGCEREIAEDIVQTNIAAGEKDVLCPYCRTQTLISDGVAGIREHDSQSDQKIYALRQKIEELTAVDAKSAKIAVANSAELADRETYAREPVRLLHLSDLHLDMSEEHLKQIVEIQLGRVRARLADRHITLTLTDAARGDLVHTGYDPRYGARPLKRAIQKKIETPLGKLLLQGTVKEGSFRMTIGSLSLTA